MRINCTTTRNVYLAYDIICIHTIFFWKIHFHLWLCLDQFCRMSHIYKVPIHIKHEQKHTRQFCNFLVLKVVLKVLASNPSQHFLRVNIVWFISIHSTVTDSIRSVVVRLGITVWHVECTIPAPLNSTVAIHCNTGLFVYS